MNDDEIKECLKTINNVVSVNNGACITQVDITERLIMAFKIGYEKGYWKERYSNIRNSNDPYRELGARN